MNSFCLSWSDKSFPTLTFSHNIKSFRTSGVSSRDPNRYQQVDNSYEYNIYLSSREDSIPAEFQRNSIMSELETLDNFYVRYYVGHRGKFGHEFLEFEIRSNGRLRYANNSQYKNDTMIRYEGVVLVLGGASPTDRTMRVGRGHRFYRFG